MKPEAIFLIEGSTWASIRVGLKILGARTGDQV